LKVTDDWRGSTPLPEGEVRRRIDAAARWARANAGKSAADLEWHWLEQERAEGASWSFQLSYRFENLREQGDPRAMPLLRALLRDPKTDAEDRARILTRYAELEPRQARRFASPFLSARDGLLRVRAALLCLPTAEADRARRLLGEYLRDAGSGEVRAREVPEAVRELLADGTPGSREAAGRVFEGTALRRVAGHERAALLREMAKEGFAEAYSFYLPLLRTKGTKFDGVEYHKPVGEAAAAELCADFAPDDEEVKAIVRKHPRLADRIPRLEEWLKARVAALEQAKR